MLLRKYVFRNIHGRANFICRDVLVLPEVAVLESAEHLLLVPFLED